MLNTQPLTKKVEVDARINQRGLWRGAFIAPWDWRHKNNKTVIFGALKAASVGGLFHSHQIVTTYSVSICSFSLRTAAIAVCVFKTAPGPSVDLPFQPARLTAPLEYLDLHFEPPVRFWWPLYLGLDH